MTTTPDTREGLLQQASEIELARRAAASCYPFPVPHITEGRADNTPAVQHALAGARAALSTASPPVDGEAKMREALERIRDLEPEPFAYPNDWSEQIAACPDCKRYEGHPIQRGICDTHRKPIWSRERHDAQAREEMGWRAKRIAREALASTQVARGGE